MGGGTYLPVKLGPWVGGINTVSDPSTLVDNEMQDCINMEVDVDGALVTRPPVTSQAGSVAWLGNGILLLGYFVFPTGNYLIGSNSTGTYYKVSGGNWILLAPNLQSTSAVMYSGSVWIVATNSSTQPSGKWDPSTGFTVVANMPRGQTILIYKDRGFIAAGESAATNSSRLYLSKVTDLTDWTSPILAAQIDINPGDGQSLVDIIIYNNAVLCLKQNSTWVFSYTLQPSDGVVRNLSTTIGVQTHHCTVSYENNIYLYHNGAVWEMVKFNYGRVNIKVPFLYDATSPNTFLYPIFVTKIGDRLVVRFYNRVYVFGLKTRTWTRWTSLSFFGPFIAEPINVAVAVNPRYYAGSCLLSDPVIYQCNNGWDNAASEAMTCTLITKNYDFSHQIRVGRYFTTQSEKNKKLFWWGLVCQTANDVVGTVTPLTPVTNKLTWGAAKSYTWAQLKLGIWSQPLGAPASINKDVFVGDGSLARFIKFPKTLRFRQINFRVDITSFGTLKDGPDRIMEIIAVASSKEYEAEGVS